MLADTTNVDLFVDELAGCRFICCLVADWLMHWLLTSR
jgi:hypothetical protein